MTPKAKPVRQCMGCRVHKPKTELMRIVRSPEGVVSLDEKGKAQGRGVYLCRNTDCLRRVRKSRALERNLKAEIPQEIFATLEAIAAGTEPS